MSQLQGAQARSSVSTTARVYMCCESVWMSVPTSLPAVCWMRGWSRRAETIAASPLAAASPSAVMPFGVCTHTHANNITHSMSKIQAYGEPSQHHETNPGITMLEQTHCAGVDIQQRVREQQRQHFQVS